MYVIMLICKVKTSILTMHSLFLIIKNTEPKNKRKETKSSSLFPLVFIPSKLSHTQNNNHDT